MDFMLMEMVPEDWSQVREIYLEGIQTGNATFETSAPDWTHWDKVHLAACRLVARGKNQVIGWAALSPVSTRAVYAGVAEDSIYVRINQRGRGVGAVLMKELIERSEALGIWMLQTSIFPENTTSLTLHQKAGFRVVGRRERIAQLKGVWRDTIFLERRSQIVGK